MSERRKLGARGHKLGLRAALREPAAGRGKAAERILRDQFWSPSVPRSTSAIRDLHASVSASNGAEPAPSRKPDSP